mgnify:CR=1 FL=1
MDMQIRTESHSKAINDDLNYLSLKCGFGTERYRFDSGQAKTATEVISENSDMYRMLKKHEYYIGGCDTAAYQNYYPIRQDFKLSP